MTSNAHRDIEDAIFEIVDQPKTANSKSASHNSEHCSAQKRLKADLKHKDNVTTPRLNIFQSDISNKTAHRSKYALSRAALSAAFICAGLALILPTIWLIHHNINANKAASSTDKMVTGSIQNQPFVAAEDIQIVSPTQNNTRNNMAVEKTLAISKPHDTKPELDRTNKGSIVFFKSSD